MWGQTFPKNRRYGDKEKRRKSVERFLIKKTSRDFRFCRMSSCKYRYSLESNEVRERKYRDDLLLVWFFQKSVKILDITSNV